MKNGENPKGCDMPINRSLAERFKPGEIIHGEWFMSEFKNCKDPGYFYVARMRFIESVIGNDNIVRVEPLDLYYRSKNRGNGRKDPCVWQMPDGESIEQCGFKRKLEINSDKEESIFDTIWNCRPQAEVMFSELERPLYHFIKRFTEENMDMDERSLLLGIMKGNLISEKYVCNRADVRQMTHSAFNTKQSRADIYMIKPEGFKYKLNSN